MQACGEHEGQRSTRSSCYIGFKVYLVPTVCLLLLMLLILLLLRSWRRTIRVILAPIGIHRLSLGLPWSEIVQLRTAGSGRMLGSRLRR